MVATSNRQADVNVERRRAHQARRSGQDRRQNINPNYSGPSRRLLLDRRVRFQDRRHQD